MFHVRHLLTQSNLSLIKKPYLLVNSNSFFKILSSNNSTSTSIQSVNVTDSCIKKLKDINDNSYLRIIVESGGCSGFEYKFSLDKNISKDDIVIERDNCKILVDTETLNFIKGSTIDYYEELIRSGFRVINNPNSEQGCSCGSSFSIKI